MKFSLLTIAGLLATTAVAAPAPAPAHHVVHEKRETASRAWVKRSRLAPKTKLPMRIGLTQSNLDKGHDLLMDV